MQSDTIDGHQELATHRGLSLMGSITERPTTWLIDIRVGTLESDSFTEHLPRLTREFGKLEGALNCGLYMIDEAKAAVDRALDARD